MNKRVVYSVEESEGEGWRRGWGAWGLGGGGASGGWGGDGGRRRSGRWTWSGRTGSPSASPWTTGSSSPGSPPALWPTATSSRATRWEITTVIGIPVRSKDEFFHRLKFAHPRLRMGFRRPPGDSGTEKSSAGELSPELEKLLRRRAGFEYLVAELDWPAQQNRQLGIVLANRMHRVIVGNLKPGSLGEEKLKVLDRIVAVNGAPVSDKDVAKGLMVEAGGKFSAVVERPVSEEARAEHRRTERPGRERGVDGPSEALVAAAGPNADPAILPWDCLAIAARERQQRAGQPRPALPGILRKAAQPSLRRSSGISHADSATSHQIQRDTPDHKRLRKTPRLFTP